MPFVKKSGEQYQLLLRMVVGHIVRSTVLNLVGMWVLG